MFLGAEGSSLQQMFKAFAVTTQTSDQVAAVQMKAQLGLGTVLEQFAHNVSWCEQLRNDATADIRWYKYCDSWYNVLGLSTISSELQYLAFIWTTPQRTECSIAKETGARKIEEEKHCIERFESYWNYQLFQPGIYVTHKAKTFQEASIDDGADMLSCHIMMVLYV